MSRSEARPRARRLVSLVAALAATSLSATSCQIGDGSCLRMSDCESGYACVEGTCRSDLAVDAPNQPPEHAVADASTTSPEVSASPPGSVDAALGDQDADLGDADAATDP